MRDNEMAKVRAEYIADLVLDAEITESLRAQHICAEDLLGEMQECVA